MSPKSLGDFFENFEGKCMKFKEILFGLGMYLGMCIVAGVMFGAMDNVKHLGSGIDCENFYVSEIIIPVTPVACLMKTRIYP
jgi:putative methionine-R-sulfoxide reductase with GAF domain